MRLGTRSTRTHAMEFGRRRPGRLTGPTTLASAGLALAAASIIQMPGWGPITGPARGARHGTGHPLLVLQPEVVVSASRTARDPIDVPMTATVIRGEGPRGSLRALPGGSVEIGYALRNTRFVDFTFVIPNGQRRDVSGNRLERMPHDLASGRAI